MPKEPVAEFIFAATNHGLDSLGQLTLHTRLRSLSLWQTTRMNLVSGPSRPKPNRRCIHVRSC